MYVCAEIYDLYIAYPQQELEIGNLLQIRRSKHNLWHTREYDMCVFCESTQFY